VSATAGRSEAEAQLLAIVGSLRSGSYNRMLYEAVRELLPDGMTIGEAPIRDVPLYDDDVRTGLGYPEPVRRLRERIAAADAVLFITPEHNHSIPGVLKNAIDWISRPPSDQPLRGKPVALMGATTGGFGTVRMQEHLRPVLASLGAFALPQPEVFVSDAPHKFDERGRLSDEKTRDVVARFLVAFGDWISLLRGGTEG